MKVILLENVKRIGSIGEVIDVKRGFARNFLISNKKALYASKENIKEVEKIKSNLAKKDNEKKTAHYQLKEHQKLIIKILNCLKNICQKMVKFYPQELQTLVKRNKENYLYQLKERET